MKTPKKRCPDEAVRSALAAAAVLGETVDLPLLGAMGVETGAMEALFDAGWLTSVTPSTARFTNEALTARQHDVLRLLAAGLTNKDRSPLDVAYADAMRKGWQEFPDNSDTGVLFAEAMMNLRPWDQWTPEGQEQPGTAATTSPACRRTGGRSSASPKASAPGRRTKPPPSKPASKKSGPAPTSKSPAPA